MGITVLFSLQPLGVICVSTSYLFIDVFIGNSKMTK